MPRIAVFLIALAAVGLIGAGVWFVMSQSDEQQALNLTTTEPATTRTPNTAPTRTTTTAPKATDAPAALKLEVSAPAGYTVRQLASVDGGQRFLLESDRPKSPPVAVILTPTGTKNLAGLRAPYAQAARRSGEIAAPKVAGSKLAVAGTPGHMYAMTYAAYDQMRVVALTWRAKHQLIVESTGEARERAAARDIVARVAAKHITITRR